MKYKSITPRIESYPLFFSSREIVLESSVKIPDDNLTCKKFMFELPQSQKFYAFPNNGHVLIDAKLSCTATNTKGATQWLLDSKRTNLYLRHSLMGFIPGKNSYSREL